MPRSLLRGYSLLRSALTYKRIAQPPFNNLFPFRDVMGYYKKQAPVLVVHSYEISRQLESFNIER